VSEDGTVYDWNKERDGFFAPFGMRGAIRHDEDAYLNKYSEHYRFKTYKIDAQQAKRALDYIDQQKAAAQARELRYKLMNDQCASFACEVTRQAGQKPPYAGTIIESPRTLYNSIGKDRE
jgi:hypothetical protein